MGFRYCGSQIYSSFRTDRILILFFFFFFLLLPETLLRLYCMETHTEQRWVLRRVECQSQYIILLYYILSIYSLSSISTRLSATCYQHLLPTSIIALLLSLFYATTVFCYRYQHFATATKISIVDFSSFVFDVVNIWDIWRLYSMETHTEGRCVLRRADCQSQYYYYYLLYYILSTLSTLSIRTSLLPLPTLCYCYQNTQGGLFSIFPAPA